MLLRKASLVQLYPRFNFKLIFIDINIPKHKRLIIFEQRVKLNQNTIYMCFCFVESIWKSLKVPCWLSSYLELKCSFCFSFVVNNWQWQWQWHLVVVLKPPTSGHNIVGQQPPTLVDVTYCVQLHTLLLYAVACCLEFLQQFSHHCSQHGRNNSQHSRANSLGSCCLRLHVAWLFRQCFPQKHPSVHPFTILTCNNSLVH